MASSGGEVASIAEGVDGESVSSKKVAKKKSYPFGTPAHAQAFSEYAHLPVTTRDFALNLSNNSTILKPDVIEEEPKRRRAAASRKADSENADEEEEKAEEIPNAEGMEACTKMACQLVLRQLAEMQFKNHAERMDLEDDYERITQDLQFAHQDVVNSEARLDKITDVGNQLEIKLQQIMTRVEDLDKKKDALSDERQEINTKMMLLQVEKQKCSRKLEKAQKALSDARWRKKKQAQAQDAEAGISFPVSEITESSILHADDHSAVSADEVYPTNYNMLARDRVVDRVERPPTLVTVPPFLQSQIYEEPQRFDYYATNHYHHLIDHSLKSWDHLKGALITSSVHSPGKHSHSHSELDSKSVLSQSMNSAISSIVSSRVSSALLKKQPPSAFQNKHSQQIVNNMQSLMDYNKRIAMNSGTVSSSASVSTFSSSKGRSIKSFNKVRSNNASVRLSPISMDKRSDSSPKSARRQSYVPTLQLTLSSEDLDRYEQLLAEDGIFMDACSFGGDSQSLDGQSKKSLDGVFYRPPIQQQWGRSHKLGEMRAVTPEKKPEKKPQSPDDKHKHPHVRAKHKIVDKRTIPRLQSRVLTTKHPGMDSFSDSRSIS